MSIARNEIEQAVAALIRGTDRTDLIDILFSTLSTNDLLKLLAKLTHRHTRTVFDENAKECVK